MPGTRTELHFHLLPAIDDGPRDDGAALALARAAVADGTRRVVATPHVRMINFGELGDRVERLNRLLLGDGIPLQAVGGGELAPDDIERCSDAELELIAHGPPGRRWVLLEAPLGPSRPDLHSAAVELRRRGFQTVIAHPERSPSLLSGQLRDLVESGAMAQINASSLIGRHGTRAEQSGLALARSGTPFVLASDAHSASRPPMLQAGALALARAGVEPAAVRFAVEEGPGVLLSAGLSPSEAFSVEAERVRGDANVAAPDPQPASGSAA